MNAPKTSQIKSRSSPSLPFPQTFALLNWITGVFKYLSLKKMTLFCLTCEFIASTKTMAYCIYWVWLNRCKSSDPWPCWIRHNLSKLCCGCYDALFELLFVAGRFPGDSLVLVVEFLRLWFPLVAKPALFFSLISLWSRADAKHHHSHLWAVAGREWGWFFNPFCSRSCFPPVLSFSRLNPLVYRLMTLMMGL